MAEKLVDSPMVNGKNYLGWYTTIDVWFLSQGLSEHLTKKVEDIIVIERDEWKRVDYQLVMMFGRKLNIFMPMIYSGCIVCS